MTTPDSPLPRGGDGGRTSSRVRAAAVAALLATFAAGVAAGVGVDQWRHHARDRERHGGGGPLPMSDRFLVPLHLTTAQRASVDSILTRRRAQLEKFWAGPGQQLRLVVDSTRNEVRAVLTPAQRATYDSLMAARRPRGGDRGGPPGMGGPPPGTPSGPSAPD